jgi:hypothetical protein
MVLGMENGGKRRFWITVIASPIPLLLVKQNWAFNYSRPLLSAWILASVVWLLLAFGTVRTLSRREKLILAGATIVACGPLLFVGFAVLMFRLSGFAP